MDDKNIFLDSGIKYISKPNSKRLINIKKLQLSKEHITKDLIFLPISLYTL